jgi:hypothetical protein
MDIIICFFWQHDFPEVCGRGNTTGSAVYTSNLTLQTSRLN